MLDAALSNRLSGGANSTHAPLVVLSDTLLQPSLLLARQFIHLALSPSSSASTTRAQPGQAQHLVLLSTRHAPHKLLPPRGDYSPAQVTLVDCSSSTLYPPVPVASSSTAPLLAGRILGVDLTQPGAGRELERVAVEAVQGAVAAQAGAAGGGVLVVIDSANALAEETEEEGGAAVVVRVAKRVLTALKGVKGSRLLITHTLDYPHAPPSVSSPSSLTASRPSLLRSLLAPSLSPSTLHLLLRPSAHLELLAREYGLSIPLSTGGGGAQPGEEEEEEEPLDPRLQGLLASLAQRAAGDPFLHPKAANEADERVPLDALGAAAASLASRGRGGESGGRGAGLRLSGAGGGCVLEYEMRGLDVLPAPGLSGAALARLKAQEREKERARAARGEVKKVVRWGVEGVVVAVDGEGRVGVREGGLGEVLNRGKMGRIGQTSSPLPTPPTAAPSSAAQPPPASSSSATPSALPFSLTLTPSQLAARAQVANPFFGNDAPIFGEQGYVQPVLPGLAGFAGGATGGAGGTVEYTPDEGDDWDDEDPDEDLEI
ncbi:hypothetical protein JCM8097_001801 [Rhodosporidiobolus ruineniae]